MKLKAEMLLTTDNELRKLIMAGKTDEQILEQEREKTKNYRMFENRDLSKEEANFDNSWDTALSEDTLGY